MASKAAWLPSGEHWVKVRVTLSGVLALEATGPQQTFLKWQLLYFQECYFPPFQLKVFPLTTSNAFIHPFIHEFAMPCYVPAGL